jgi:LuxR family maltose regulon positive regulatory protein
VSQELIATKLHRPSLRPGIVSRPRLLKHLDDGLSRKLILVSAPAGSGKSTLVAEWAQQLSHPLAWVSLNEGDNDPAHFIAYVQAALKIPLPQLNDLLDPAPYPLTPASIEATVARLINALDEIQDDIVLVLDDYHVIESRQIHQLLAFLLTHLPEQAHLCLITRADPPIPLARLRARNQLVELRGTDLGFTHEESAAFLNRVMGLNLSSDDIVKLDRRTQGWITGLQLAGLSLQDHTDARQFISTFSGSHEYVADYLIDEVLERQPTALRDFLLQTSILERLSGPLCEAVTGQPDGQQTLEHLQACNLFVSALDTRRQWYAYHRLFADLLRLRLQTTQRDLIHELHRRAASWYVQQGLPEEAITHYLAAGEVGQAADRIAELAESMLMKSQNATLLKWVDQLPETALWERPDLLLYTTWALMLNSYSLDAIKSYLQELERIDPVRLLPLKAYVAYIRGQIGDARAMANQALKHLTEKDRFLHNMASWLVSLAELVEVDLQSSSREARKISQIEHFSGNLFIVVMTLCNLAEFTTRQGRLHEAHAIYQRALTLSTSETTEPQPIAGMALIGLGAIHREWNDLHKAEELTLEGIDLVVNWSQTATLDGYATLFFIHVAQGRHDEAQATLDQAQRLALLSDAFDLDDLFICLLQARFWIVRGDFDRAQQCLVKAGGSPDAGTPVLDDTLSYIDYHLRHHQNLTLARLWMAQGRYDEALDLLERLATGIERFGWHPSRREIEVLILKALTLHALRRLDPALIVLEQALAQAEPGGYIRTFIDEGSAMTHLLEEAAKRGIHTAYARRLIATSASPTTASPLLDPLTGREIEVLHLIAKGLTNPQIAEQLIVATGTVKAHTSSIYSKLGVTNRVQAVARARELGLI